MFTYQELESYSEIVNVLGSILDDVKYYMQGAFPDSSGPVDLVIARRKAAWLQANAEALVNELRGLYYSQDLTSHLHVGDGISTYSHGKGIITRVGSVAGFMTDKNGIEVRWEIEDLI